jgi:hypothetical protein
VDAPHGNQRRRIARDGAGCAGERLVRRAHLRWAVRARTTTLSPSCSTSPSASAN